MIAIGYNSQTNPICQHKRNKMSNKKGTTAVFFKNKFQNNDGKRFN